MNALAARRATMPSLRTFGRALAVATCMLATASCQTTQAVSPPSVFAGTAVQALPPVVEDLEHRTFNYFWELGSPANGLVPDRWPTPSFSSIAAVGFGLTAYGVGVERGWISREQAADRTLATLRFFARCADGELGA